MNSFSFSFFQLLSSTALDKVGMAIGLFAAACIITAFSPQAYQVYVGKNTTGVNEKMLFLNLFVAIGFGTWAVCNVINGNPGIGLPHLICNLVVFLLSLFILNCKLQNMRSAKAMGLTEEKYWKDHIFPNLQVVKGTKTTTV